MKAYEYNTREEATAMTNYLTIVNKIHRLPEDWLESITLVSAKNAMREAYQLESETMKQFLALRDTVQKGIGHGILSLHPLGGLGTCVVLEPAVGVGHFGAEIFVYGIVAGCGGVVDALCRSRGAENRHGDDKNVACPHVFRIDELNEL